MSDYMVEQSSGPVAIRYKRVAVWIHWISALLILTQIYIGFRFHRFLPEGSPERMDAFAWHKTLGALILVLALARLAVRLLNPPPPYPADFPKWQRFTAVWSHRLLYVLMIGLPLTGLIAISDGAKEGMIALQFGQSIPAIPGISEATGDLFGELHEKLAWGLGVLLVVHVAAALYNQFGSNTDVADRMPPFRARR